MIHEKCSLESIDAEESATLSDDKLHDYLSSLHALLHERCVILKWHQNWISNDTAELHVVGVEQSSVPVFLFDGKGEAKIFKSVADAEHYATVITEGFTHMDTGTREMYFQMIPKRCRLELNLVLKAKADAAVMCFNVNMVAVRIVSSAN